MSWEETTLGHLISETSGLIQTGPFGTQLKQAEYTEEGVPVIMPKDIKGGRIKQDTVARISETKANKLERHKVKPDTIVFPRRGEITKRAYITKDQAGWICGTGCLRIEPPDGVIHPKFLYYFMGTLDSIDWLQKNAVGATMLNLSGEILGRFPIKYPDLPTQERIASVLSAYDDLIENNRRRIALLEQAARLLYREWFVYFRFPGHETAKFVDGLPEGWELRSIGEHCPFVYGKALTADTRIAGGVDVYGSSGIVGKHNKKLVDGNAIVIGRKGNVGSVFWARNDFWPIDTAYYVAPKNSDLFTFYALENVTFINTDVAVPGLNRNFAHSRLLAIPDDDLLVAFNNQVGLLMDQTASLKNQAEKLTAARDLLLPRLMDGRIPV